jgi:hypothetical protein
MTRSVQDCRQTASVDQTHDHNDDDDEGQLDHASDNLQPAVPLPRTSVMALQWWRLRLTLTPIALKTKISSCGTRYNAIACIPEWCDAGG